jgi:hypothetical protein
MAISPTGVSAGYTCRFSHPIRRVCLTPRVAAHLPDLHGTILVCSSLSKVIDTTPSEAHIAAAAYTADSVELF